MRKILPLLSILLPVVVSCYEKVLLPAGEEEPVLVMNAQMNNLEEVHSVALSVSYLSKVEPLQGADVKVYVNGVFSTEAAEWPDAREFNASWYGFEADFQPGDVVRLEVSAGSFSASSTVTVPPLAEVTLLDTASVRMTFMDEVSDYLQVKARFQDLPGPSWYGVDCLVADSCEYLDDDGIPVPKYSVARTEMRAWLETGFDPVISEGAGKTPGGDLASLLYAPNEYNCFSDSPIADDECTLRVLIHPMSFYLGDLNYGIYYPDGVGEDEFELLMGYSRRIKRKCYFRLRSLPFEQYHYLKALSNLETFGTDFSFLVEPTTLPSNVEGGLGFVGIETVSGMEFASFEKTYPPVDVLYTY